MSKLILVISMPLFMLPWQWDLTYPGMDNSSEEPVEVVAKKLVQKK